MLVLLDCGLLTCSQKLSLCTPKGMLNFQYLRLMTNCHTDW